MAGRGPGNPKWVKGCPGPNPGGRPKKLDEFVADLTAAGANDLAVKLLVDLLSGAQGEMRDRVEALKLVTAYMYGKPRQQLNVEGQVAHQHQHLVAAVSVSVASLPPERQRALLEHLRDADRLLEAPKIEAVAVEDPDDHNGDS